MSETPDCKRAVNCFHNFVATFLLVVSHHTGAATGRSPDAIDVGRDEVLNAFFRKNPEHAPYRVEVADSLGSERTFHFSKKLWTTAESQPNA